jgi:hypothetical protein
MVATLGRVKMAEKDEKLDLPLAVEIADLAKVVGTDDIDIDKVAQRLQEKHPDTSMTADEIGDALNDEIERNWSDDFADAEMREEPVDTIDNVVDPEGRPGK